MSVKTESVEVVTVYGNTYLQRWKNQKGIPALPRRPLPSMKWSWGRPGLKWSRGSQPASCSTWRILIQERSGQSCGVYTEPEVLVQRWPCNVGVLMWRWNWMICRRQLKQWHHGLAGWKVWGLSWQLLGLRYQMRMSCLYLQMDYLGHMTILWLHLMPLVLKILHSKMLLCDLLMRKDTKGLTLSRRRRWPSFWNQLSLLQKYDVITPKLQWGTKPLQCFCICH